MASIPTSIKNKIKELLDELVNNQTLKETHVDDLKMGALDRDYGGYPVAVLSTPTADSAPETNRDNARIYTYEILVIHKAEEVQDATAIEDLLETILNKFDNDALNVQNSKLRAAGADGGVEPSTSPVEQVTSRGKAFIVFSVILRCKNIYRGT